MVISVIYPKATACYAEMHDIFPKWINNKWLYRGEQFRSLRLMKSRPGHKLETALSKHLVINIRRDVDNEIINDMRALATRWHD